MKIKSLIIVAFLLFSFICFGQYTDVINSNRPGESFGAFSVGKSIFQSETGFSILKEKHELLDYEANGFGTEAVIRFGVFKEELEAILEINYQNDTYVDINGSFKRSGLRNTTLGAKYLIYDPFKYRKETVNLYSWKANHKFKWNQLIPAVAASAGANINFSNNPFLFNSEPISKISPKVMLITQNKFSNGFVFVTNVFVDRIGTESQSIEYILTLTKGFNDRWSGFVENKGIKGDYYSDAIIRTGAAYLLTKNMQLDASVSTNFKNTPTIFYFGAGLSWRFDANYKEVVLRDKSFKGDKKKKPSKKEKKNKRLDEVDLEK
jgi:hypothetical protein